MRYNDVFEQMTIQLKRGIPQVDVARAINIDPRALNQRKKKNSRFSAEEIEQLERLFAVKFQEPEQNNDCHLLKDVIDEISAEKREKITREKIGDIFGVSRQRVTAMLNKPVPPHRLKILEDVFCMTFNETLEQHPEVCADEFLNVPVRGEVNASCGNGLCVYDEQQTAIYPISQHLFRSLGANPSETEIIFASGDSMQPEIKDGDALMVDKSKNEVIDGQIYIIRYDSQLSCKRLQKLPPNKLKVISDNEKYDAYYLDFSKEIDIDFAVIGKVLWYSRIAR